MVHKSFDAIVIGTGQSGPSLAVDLAGAGKKVAIVERARFGGTCVNTGCIPTKAMVASARAVHVARRHADFGVVIDGAISVDMVRVKARKDQISAASRDGLEKMLYKTDNCTVIRGQARFKSDHEIEVNAEVLESDQIFINVGGRADIPAIEGLSGIPYFTNSSILEIDFLPRHLIVVGGSYIGLEFGQMFRRFGSEVTIVERGPRLLGREDKDVSAGIQQILQGEGIGVAVDAECIKLTPSGGGVEAQTAANSSSTVWGSHVLVATGRRPNTDDLGLESTGIERDDHGYIRVDDELRTTADGVWAIGDCNGKGAFTHTSYNDYEIVAANLFGEEKRRVSDRISAYCVYIDPPLGRVGMTEEQVRNSGRPALIAKRPMTRVGRAFEKSETQGFMKAMVDAETKQILGAAILGTGGDEAIHSILDVMYAKAPYTLITHAVHIHPTVSELIPTMLEDLKPMESGDNQ